jgi:hypothetical protein
VDAAFTAQDFVPQIVDFAAQRCDGAYASDNNPAFHEKSSEQGARSVEQE